MTETHQENEALLGVAPWFSSRSGPYSGPHRDKNGNEDR